MPCEHYQNALIEAAASSTAPQGELRAHLATCAACRTAFAQEQSLFSSIDEGLHAAANAAVPASLLPRVRARLADEAAPRRMWTQPVIFAAVSAALAFAIFLLAQLHHAGPDNQAKQTPQISVSGPPATNSSRQNSGPAAQFVVSSVNNSRSSSHPTLLRPVASSEPEVLVPPDEREAFARFVAALQERSELNVALVTPLYDEKDEPASLKPLQIDRLEVKPLDGTESEASRGAEKHSLAIGRADFTAVWRINEKNSHLAGVAPWNAVAALFRSGEAEVRRKAECGSADDSGESADCLH